MLFGVLVDGIGVFEIMNQVVAWLTIALSLGEGWVLWGLGGKKVEDLRNAYIHLRLNQFSITAHNIFTYFPMQKKVEDSRNAHIHLRLNQFSITAHNIFTYDPIPQKQGRRFRKCMYTYLRFSQIYNTIFSHIFAEKFGLGQNVEALTSAILSRYEDLSRFTHVLEIFGHKKSFFWGV